MEAAENWPASQFISQAFPEAALAEVASVPLILVYVIAVSLAIFH